MGMALLGRPPFISVDEDPQGSRVILNPDSPVPVIAWKSGWMIPGSGVDTTSKHSLEPART